MKNIKILISILIIGSVLRLTYLTITPPSLNWDEVSHGYNAYSILKTGTDEWGNFPLTNFRAYGDYPLPLNLFLTIPFVCFMGLSELSIRLPHAILGILTIFVVYHLVLGIFKKPNLALLSAFLVAVGPFYVFTSRFVLQSNLSVFLLILALALFFNRDKHKCFLPLSAISFGLTLFSYHTTRIFTPLLLVLLLFVYRKDLKKSIKNKSTMLALLIVVLFFLPLPYILSKPEARARSTEVFLLDEGAINKINELRNSSTFPAPLDRLLYNKPTYFLIEFTKNYFGYFSPDFLFLKGGTQYQFSVPNHGQLYLTNLPFFYIGLFILLRGVRRKDKNYLFLFGWLLIAPIPASMTLENFAVLRVSTIYPLPEILVGIGLFWVWERSRFKQIDLRLPLQIVYFVLTLLFIGNYINTYFNDYRKHYSWSWQYGYKEIVGYVKENYDEYDQIIFTKKYGEPHEFVLFYWGWDPSEFKTDKNLVRFNQSNWYWVDRFGKFYFVNDWEIEDNNNHFVTESGLEINCDSKKCLLITAGNKDFSEWKFRNNTLFLDGSVAFEIYENN